MTQKEIELKIERIENSLQLALTELQAIKVKGHRTTTRKGSDYVAKIRAKAKKIVL